MDFLIELLLEIILEGSFEAVSEKRVPFPIRILLTIVLIVFFVGVFAFLFYLGVKHDVLFMTIIAAILFVLFILGMIKKIKDFKRK